MQSASAMLTSQSKASVSCVHSGGVSAELPLESSRSLADELVAPLELSSPMPVEPSDPTGALSGTMHPLNTIKIGSHRQIML